jgi:hypothetical protein
MAKSNFNVSVSKIIMLGFVSLFLISKNNFAQSPGVEWRNYTWLNTEYIGGASVDQRHSDYDWWYDHCTAYTNPLTKTGHLGYIGCGVSDYRCGERSGQSPISYDETSTAYGTYANGCTVATALITGGGYDYGNWDNPISGHLGLDFNSIGRVSPSGQTDFLFSSNYGGEYLRVKQLSDGTFLTVGSTTATRKRLNATSQSGTPLYYNPTSSSPTDYFINTDIFTGDISLPTNRDHWDVMRFDANGNAIFNNIYGLFDFSAGGATFTDVDNTTKNYSAKQIAFMFSGSANDFAEDAQNNIAVVGSNAVYNETRINPYDVNSKEFIAKPVLIKLDASGNVLGKKILGQGYTGNQKSGVALAITVANISGVDCYVVLSQINDWGTTGFQLTNILIEAFPINNLSAPNVWTKFIAGPAPVSSAANPNGNRNSTCWGITFKNNKLYVPLITDCNFCVYAGNNMGNLYMNVYDLTNTNDGTNTVSSVLLSSVHAFDLKSRITELSSGDFAVISTRKTANWSTTRCPGSTPPNYITGDYSSTPNTVANTDWWNTDTYVAKINAAGAKIWDKSFDSDTPVNCNDYPTTISSGGGDPKKQECMYGVSEAPDGGIVLSGNNSSNVDDNYMAKLYSDCNSMQTYDIGSINIHNTGPISITINSSKKINGILRVYNGGTLNINGAGTILEFADSKLIGAPCGIEVYQGGVVNINGATLTSIANCPGSMWDGIKMYGKGIVFSQTTNNQPSVNITGATIKNARTGIANGFPGTPYSLTGGWIIANNTTFLNNYIDVDFLDYKAPLVASNEPNNKSYFKGCTFKADNYLNDPSYVQTLPGIIGNVRMINSVHVNLSGVKGIRFIGNTFKTDLTALGGTGFYTNLRSTGIKSNNSTFSVFSTCVAQDIYGNCTGYATANTFENLQYGVYAQATNPLKNLTVTSANFTNCFSSVYQSGVGYSTVNKNNFLVNTTIPAVAGHFNCSTHPEACMTHFYYANNVSGFSHQENTYLVASTSTQKVMGTLFNSCGTASNESYHNTYTNCYIGHQSQLTNGASGTGINGLQIKCNQNITSKQNDILQTSGIMGQQGYCDPTDIKTPANNTFSHYTGATYSDINGASASGFAYKFNNNLPAGTQVPTSISPNINLSAPCFGLGQFSYNSATCPSKLTITTTVPPGGAIAKLQSDALNNKQTATQLNQVLIDGASQSLITAIASSTNDGTLKNTLSQYSPYLSDAVLIAYLQKTPSTPSGHIKQIVTDNSPVTTKVMSVLNTISLPNGIRNQINNAQVGVSARTQREQEIAYYNFQKDLNVNEIVRYYLDDTTTTDTYGNIIKWLEWNNSLPSKLDLIFAKTETGDVTRAQSLIDSLAIDTANTKYLSYLQVNKDMAVNGKTWESLQTDPSTRTTIEAIANDSLHPHMGHARAALAHAFKDKTNYEYIEGISHTNTNRLANNYSNESASKDNMDGINLIAYPNPFKNELNINYSILDFEGVAQLQLIELASGRVIDNIELTQSFGTKQFNTENMANGLYVLSLKQNNKPSVNFKVINIK